MKLISPLPHKRGRLEIIPLIDIMFFLLAAFMVVSINKIRVDSLKINLPTDVPATQHENKEDFVNIAVTTDGEVRIDKDPVDSKEMLLARLKELFAKNKDQKILISADRDTTHGDVMGLLGKIRLAGFQKVAFSIKGDKTAVPQGVAPTAGASPAPALTPATVPASAPPAPAPVSPAVLPEPAPPAPAPAH